MNTPAHLLLGGALFARPHRPALLAAALCGAALPDLSVFVMVGWEHLILGRPPALVFGHDYRDPFWQGIFAVDNSIPLWSLALLLGLLLRRPLVVAFAGAGLLHILCDLPLHNEDARRHFWPLSDWIWRAPLSYWDPNRHAAWVAPAELALALAAAACLYARLRGRAGRVALVAAAGVEALLALGPVAAAALGHPLH